MNEEQIIKKAMAILGSRTSPRKKRTSRLNARRPRKRRAKSAKLAKINTNKPIALANG